MNGGRDKHSGPKVSEGRRRHSASHRTRVFAALSVSLAAALAVASLAYQPLKAGAASSQGAPSAPLDVVVTNPVVSSPDGANPAADADSATVSWEAPVTGGVPTGYTVTATPSAVGASAPTTTSTSSTSTSSSSTSTTGDPTSTVTSTTATGPTSTVTSTMATTTTAPGPLTCSTTATLTCEVTGLAEYVPYTFAVVASNASGSSASASSSATVMAGATLTVIASATQDLVDGQAVQVTVTSTDSQLNLTQGVYWAWCQEGSPLPPEQAGPTSGDPLTTQNVGFVGPDYCTSKPFSTTVTPQSDQLVDLLDSTGIYPSVSGTVVAEVGSTDGDAGVTPLTCDAGDPCDLGLSVQQASNSSDYYDFAIPVTYTISTVTGCAGNSPNVLQTVGPASMSDWTVGSWQVGACQAGVGGSSADPVANLAQDNEASDLANFASGTDDLAYSAVGYNVPGFTPTTQRPYVAVPVAINAVVLAVGDGYDAASSLGPNPGVFVPWSTTDTPQLTLAEAAYLLANCDPSTSSTAGTGINSALVDSNSPYFSGLSPDQNLTTPLNQSGNSYGVYADAAPDPTTYFATNFFDTDVQQDWNTGPVTGGPPGGNCGRVAGGQADTQLGVTSDFGADLSFNVYGYTGYPNLQKDVAPADLSASNQADLPAWTLTDAATAANTWGGMAVAQLQTPDSLGSAAPTFAGPSQQSMDAAVADMVPQPDGTLLPNPHAAPATSGPLEGVEPYPLTFVEYALAPAEPLLNADCTPDTAKQQLLTQWLDYITGQGQSLLSPGMQPLTPALQAQAASAIALVGQAPVTGACGPPGQPTGVVATVAANGSTTVSWVAPTSTGGSPISDYKVVVVPFGGTSTTIDTHSTATSFTIPDLAAYGSPTGSTTTTPGATSTTAGATTTTNAGTTTTTVNGATTTSTVPQTAGAVYSISVEAVNQQGTGFASTAALAILPSSATTTTTAPSSQVGAAVTTAPPTTTTVPGQTQGTLPPLVTGQDFGVVVAGTISAGSSLTLQDSYEGADATLTVPAGALPPGTTVNLVAVTNGAAFGGFIPSSQAVITGSAVLWQAPDGSSPPATQPVSLTISDSAIGVGDKVFLMAGPKAKAIGSTTTTGTVTVPFEAGAIVLIAGPKPTPTPPPALQGTSPAPAKLTGPTVTTQLTTYPTTVLHSVTTSPQAAVSGTKSPTTAVATLNAPPPGLETPTSTNPVVAVPSTAGTSITATTLTSTIPQVSAAPKLISLSIPPYGGRDDGGWGIPVGSAAALVLILGGTARLTGRRPGRVGRRARASGGGGGR